MLKKSFFTLFFNKIFNQKQCTFFDLIFWSFADQKTTKKLNFISSIKLSEFWISFKSDVFKLILLGKINHFLIRNMIFFKLNLLLFHYFRKKNIEKTSIFESSVFQKWQKPPPFFYKTVQLRENLGLFFTFGWEIIFFRFSLFDLFSSSKSSFFLLCKKGDVVQKIYHTTDYRPRSILYPKIKKGLILDY